MYVGDFKIALPASTFYKGIMLAVSRITFTPFGAWHTAWTQRAETVIRYASRSSRT